MRNRILDWFTSIMRTGEEGRKKTVTIVSIDGVPGKVISMRDLVAGQLFKFHPRRRVYRATNVLYQYRNGKMKFSIDCVEYRIAGRERGNG